MKIVTASNGKKQVKISKSEWETIGRKAGWIKVAQKVSDCCNAPDKKCEPDRGMTNNFYSDINMCPKCKNKCKFVEKKAQKTAQYSDGGLPDDTGISQKDDLSRHVQNDLFMSILGTIKGNMDQSSLMELEMKLQELSTWIVDHLSTREASSQKTIKEAKKKKQYNKSPKEHGFIDECIKKNKDKDNPGAYCASIVDKAKGTTDWRKGPKD